MKTTVVIPNYNGIEYIRACLDSLRAISDEDFAIIVVDNGSADGSREIVEQEYPEAELIALSENTGFAAAVNTGINAVKTPYCILLNNDTEAKKGFVKNLERRLDSDSRIFSVNSKMIQLHDPGKLDGCGDYYCALGWAYAYLKDAPANLADRNNEGMQSDNDGASADMSGQNNMTLSKPRQIFSACGGASAYRVDVLKEIGMFDELHFAYLEDVDVGYRAKIKGYINVFEPEAEVYHAGSGSSGSRYNTFKIELSSRNNVYLIIKNMPFLQILINLPFLLIGYLVKTAFFILKGFGGIYVKGLINGLRLGFSAEGRAHRVRFRLSDLPSYVRIQLELWVNIVRRFLRI
ncbi:MAG: glycosyltransferase family 2 protein [Lachnospiraceae bacterium]|nr:glycosyltransferase family 2 protein [Lachnospiraceae bacterium]